MRSRPEPVFLSETASDLDGSQEGGEALLRKYASSEEEVLAPRTVPVAPVRFQVPPVPATRTSRGWGLLAAGAVAVGSFVATLTVGASLLAVGAWLLS